MPRQLPPGIFRTPTGYRAYQWVPAPGYPKGRIASKRFPATATIEAMVAWRTAQHDRARQRTAQQVVAPMGAGFLADADRYLEVVQAMPSWQERRRELRAWAVCFGEQPTETITSTQIRAVRDQWLTRGPKRVQERQPDGSVAWVEKPLPLAPQSVNLRLRALENVFTVLFPGQPNPVREVPECLPPDPQPRGETFSLALEVLACMPDITRPEKGGTPEAGSKSRARFQVMLLTGLSASQVGRLTPEDIDWSVPAYRAPRRQKGRRGRQRQRGKVQVAPLRPLVPEAVPALQHLFALGANAPFKSASITRSVRRAIVAANRIRTEQQLPLIPLTLQIKDLTRHTFGTEVFRATRNLTHVQQLLGHSDAAMSQRYAMAAIREDLLLGIGELSKRVRGGKVGRQGGGRNRSRPGRNARPRIRRKA